MTAEARCGYGEMHVAAESIQQGNIPPKGKGIRGETTET